MSTRAEQKALRKERREQEEALERDAVRARQLRNRVLGAVLAAVGVLGIIFAASQLGGGNSGPGGSGGKYAYSVGSPGPGQQAPEISLPATTGGSFNLAATRGKNVLLYFQEGLGCQPCWEQLKDLESQSAKVRALGIDQIVTITGNALGDLRQKAEDEGLSTPVLSDGDLAVSEAYAANQYGMMGEGSDGHSFVIVGPDGRIRWRADYGGAPNFTMYVPVPSLLADMREGLRGAA